MQSACPADREESRYYAVIYGAANKAGKIFANYLAFKHNFNLILIDSCKLSEVEDELVSKFIDQSIEPPNIIKVELNNFEIKTIQSAL